jgi:DNA-binding MurR/RpiR family transcriptional regulator
LGGRFTRLIAEILWGQLAQVRSKVTVIPQSAIRFEAAALDLGRRDVVVVFDLRRYQKETISFARVAHEQGAKIALITDPWLSPIAEFSDRVITCAVEYPSPFDSLLPCLAVVEAILAAVTAKLGKEGKARIERLEAMRNRLASAASTSDAEPLKSRNARRRQPRVL